MLTTVHQCNGSACAEMKIEREIFEKSRNRRVQNEMG